VDKKELEAKVAELEATIAEKDQMITALNEQMKEAESAPRKGPKVVTIGKEKVTILMPSVKVPGVGKVTVTDLKEGKIKVDDETVFEYLKRKKSGMFRIEAKK